MATRSRVKLDLGPHGKVLASVVDFDDARAVAAARFSVEPSGVQLYVSDGEDLWELHPSAFQDVVAENGVIVAKALNPPASSTTRSVAATASTTISTASSPVTKSDSPRGVPSPTASAARPSQQAGPSTSTPLTLTSRVVRPRASSSASSASTSSTSSASSSSTSSSSSSSSAASDRSSSSSSTSSSASSQGRRSESVQDVTATSATVRTVMGPNGVPVSSKERWDPNTHRLMFEKLNEIINNETIYYTRKYTEERYRIFQLLIDNYGDMGIKGNFLRGRTAQALISRVSGVLRNARERGEKVKQPFKFFFPNKRDDGVSVRSATVPAAPTVTSSPSNGRAATQPNGAGTRAQTQPAQARGTPHGKGKGSGATAVATSSQTPAQSAAAANPSDPNGTQAKGKGKGKGKGTGKGKGKGKGKDKQKDGQANPPEIRRRTANAAALPHSASSPARPPKRPANGTSTTTPPKGKKQQKRPNKQAKAPPNRDQGQYQEASLERSRGQSLGRDRSRSRAGPSNHRSRSASPRPGGNYRDGDDDRYSQRVRDRSPRRGRDSWSRPRDEPAYEPSAADGWDDEDRQLRPPPSSLPRRPSWTNSATQRDEYDGMPPSSSTPRANRGSRSGSGMGGSLFRAETRSPPPTGRRSPTLRSTRWKGKASPRPTQNLQSSPRTRRNAVERALEHLAAAGADTSIPVQSSSQNGGSRERVWGGAHRSWHRNDQDGSDGRRNSTDTRRSMGHHQQQQERQQQPPRTHIRYGEGINAGWASSIADAERFAPPSPRTPPRSD
ncbi:uncharacterized protein UTRI_03542_B [Ustilago trichophora]|uniref:Uncharacterized protein n=1 Tax=Ustilago trichophora TaxID=86804 RepID=A0A5C3DZP2_9BASI|nr:uncharacterized protein UTRI_03542_B [Ustilago trichophora]